MPEPTEAELFTQGLWTSMKERAAGAARVYGPGSNNKELTPDEEATIWNTRTMPLEKEWDLWRQGLTPEEIGLQVFGDREKLVKSGGRLEPKDWARKIESLMPRAKALREAQQQQEAAVAGPMDGMPTEGGF